MSLVTICHITKLLQFVDYILCAVRYSPITDLFYDWKFVSPNPFYHLSILHLPPL